MNYLIYFLAGMTLSMIISVYAVVDTIDKNVKILVEQRCNVIGALE